MAKMRIGDLERINEGMGREIEQKQRFSLDYYLFTMIGMVAAIVEIFWASIKDAMVFMGCLSER